MKKFNFIKCGRVKDNKRRKVVDEYTWKRK